MKPNQLFAHWEQVRKDTILTIDKFSEEELFFIPFKSSWPVGKIALHIAHCEAHWLHDIVMNKSEPQFSWELSDHTSKPEIIDVLNRTHEKTLSFLNGLDEKDLEVIYTTPH